MQACQVRSTFSYHPSCWNEWRICQNSNEGDHNAQSVLSNWHSQCDNIATPTTPSLTTLPASVSQCPVQVRQQFQAACTQVIAAGNACYAQYPALSQSVPYSSCVCQTSILSLASVCEYDGNKTCLGRTPTLSDIPLWSFCPVRYVFYLACRTQVSGMES